MSNHRLTRALALLTAAAALAGCSNHHKSELDRRCFDNDGVVVIAEADDDGNRFAWCDQGSDKAAFDPATDFRH